MHIREHAVLKIASVELFAGKIHVVKMDSGRIHTDYFVVRLDITAYLAVELRKIRMMVETEAVSFDKFAVFVERG
jgi:hypothetical protein